MQIKPSKVIRFLEKRVKPFFRIKLSKRSKFSKDEIFEVISQMSIQNTFAEGTCNYRKNIEITFSPDTFLRTIKNTDICEIENSFILFNKKAIKIAKRQGLFNAAVPIAIDWIDIMFYGDKETPMIVGTQHKKGSNYAYRYMTASILTERGRFVIAAQPFLQAKDEILPEVIHKMINEIQKEIKISHILFDRGFYNLRLISLLKSMDIKFMIHLPMSKRIRKISAENKFPFLIEYQSEAHGNYPRDKFNLLGLEWTDKDWFFATNIDFDKSLQGAIEIFRKRWGVETSYRMVNQFLPKTTSKSYTIRMFYFFFACMMYNTWVLFNLIKIKTESYFHIPVLFFKNLLLVLFLNQKKVG